MKVSVIGGHQSVSISHRFSVSKEICGLYGVESGLPDTLKTPVGMRSDSPLIFVMCSDPEPD